MAEIVSLDDFRIAREIVASREWERKWHGLRFRDIKHDDYFVLPELCDREGRVYLKVEDSVAMSRSPFDEEGDLALEGCDFLVPPDMPVIPLFE